MIKDLWKQAAWIGGGLFLALVLIIYVIPKPGDNRASEETRMLVEVAAKVKGKLLFGVEKKYESEAFSKFCEYTKKKITLQELVDYANNHNYRNFITKELDNSFSFYDQGQFDKLTQKQVWADQDKFLERVK